MSHYITFDAAFNPLFVSGQKVEIEVMSIGSSTGVQPAFSTKAEASENSHLVVQISLLDRIFSGE